MIPPGASTAQKDWFLQACEKKISCDILVVSGHFSGSFHGSSGFSLSANDLESYSCNSKCHGILNNPKEVFLFGCNTLALKDGGRQSLDGMMAELMRNGFNREQASQVVVFRRSEFGRAMAHRMTDIFPKTPRIYGFSKVSPSGAQVEPLLTQYLSENKERYANFDTASTDTSRNKALFSALKKTTLTQKQGSMPDLKSVEDKPYCYIRSNRVPGVEKIRYIESLFAEGNAMQMIAHIEDVVKYLNSRWSILDEPSRRALLHLKNNQTVRQELIRFLALKGDAYITFKAQVINALMDLDMIDSETSVHAFNSLVDLSSPFTQTRHELLCRANLQMNIPYSVIPEQRWSEEHFLNALGCLRPSDSAIYRRLSSILVEAGASMLRRSTAAALLWNARRDDAEVQSRLIEAIRKDQDSNVRYLAVKALMDSRPTATKIRNEIFLMRTQESDSRILKALSQNF